MSIQSWYAIYTRHQHEKNVAQILSYKGFQTFLPLYSAVHHWKDRNRQLSLPLFPCYVFLHSDLQRAGEILKTPAVFTFVSSGGRPAIIPDEDLEAVRQVV